MGLVDMPISISNIKNKIPVITPHTKIFLVFIVPFIMILSSLFNKFSICRKWVYKIESVL